MEKTPSRLAQALALRKGLELSLKGITVSRAWTKTNMLHAVSGFTGNTYVRSNNGVRAAIADITRWIET